MHQGNQGHPPDIEEHIRIGDLLTEAGIVTRGDVIEAIQISKRMKLPIGRVLVMSGVLTELLLTAALQVQEYLRDNKLTIEQSYDVLNHVHANQCVLDVAMEVLDCKPTADLSRSKLGLLLVDSDICSPDQIEEALTASFGSGIPLGSMLVLQGMLSAQLLPGILDAQERLRAGKINHVDAVSEIRTQFDYWAHANDSKHNQEFLTLHDQGSAPGLVTQSGPRVAATGMKDLPSTGGMGKKKRKDGSPRATGSYPALIITGEHPAATTGSYPALIISGEHPAATTGQHPVLGDTGKHKAVDRTIADAGKFKSIGETGKNRAGDTGKHKATTEFGGSGKRSRSGGWESGEREALESGSYGDLEDTASLPVIGGEGGKKSKKTRQVDRPPLPVIPIDEAATRSASGNAKSKVIPIVAESELFHLENNEDLSMISLLEMGGLVTREDMQDGVKEAFKDAETTIRLAGALGLLSKKHVEAAIRCYQLVSQWKLTIPEAVGVLAEVRVTDQSIDSVLAKHHLAEDEE